jgi:hypothetical protein
LNFWQIKPGQTEARTTCQTGPDFYQNEHSRLSLSIQVFLKKSQKGKHKKLPIEAWMILRAEKIIKRLYWQTYQKHMIDYVGSAIPSKPGLSGLEKITNTISIIYKSAHVKVPHR